MLSKYNKKGIHKHCESTRWRTLVHDKRYQVKIYPSEGLFSSFVDKIKIDFGK